MADVVRDAFESFVASHRDIQRLRGNKLATCADALTISNDVLIRGLVIRIKKRSYLFALEVSNIGAFEIGLLILRQLTDGLVVVVPLESLT
jgi:hypothetical protein